MIQWYSVPRWQDENFVVLEQIYTCCSLDHRSSISWTGITNFDLIGNFGSMDWLGHYYLILFINIVFAAATTGSLVTKFTATVRREIYLRLKAVVSHDSKGQMGEKYTAGSRPHTAVKEEKAEWSDASTSLMCFVLFLFLCSFVNAYRLDNLLLCSNMAGGSNIAGSLAAGLFRLLHLHVNCLQGTFSWVIQQQVDFTCAKDNCDCLTRPFLDMLSFTQTSFGGSRQYKSVFTPFVKGSIYKFIFFPRSILDSNTCPYWPCYYSHFCPQWSCYNLFSASWSSLGSFSLK